MWIKRICHVLLACPRPALGISLFSGSQTCTPNHLHSSAPCLEASCRKWCWLQGRSLVSAPALTAGTSPSPSPGLHFPLWNTLELGPFPCWCPKASGSVAWVLTDHTNLALSFLFPTFQWPREEEDVEWDAETSSRSEDKFICWTELYPYFFLLGYLWSAGFVLMYIS